MSIITCPELLPHSRQLDKVRCRGCEVVRCEVVIADDHPVLVDGFKSLLEPEFNVVGSANDGVELLAVAQKLRPDVILIDIGLPLLNGLAAGEELKQLLPRTKLIVVTIHAEIDIVGQAMSHWASGYVLKSCVATELTKAVREVVNGRAYVSPSLARRLNDEFVRDPRLDRQRILTPRQQKVLQLLAEGRTMREAADVLQVTARTVAFHKYHIMEEFGLRNNSELVRFAIKEGLIRAFVPLVGS